MAKRHSGWVHCTFLLCNSNYSGLVHTQTTEFAIQLDVRIVRRVHRCLWLDALDGSVEFVARAVLAGRSRQGSDGGCFVPTAIVLTRIIPRALTIRNNGEWIRANANLKTEILERKDLELDLRVSEARYRDIAELLDLTHDAILARNLSGQIIYWNRGAERLYGWQKEEVQGRISSELLSTVYPQPVEEIERQLLELGYWEGELVQKRRDEEKVIVSSRWALRSDVTGKPNAVLETYRDITRRIQDEGKFRAFLEAAPDAMVIVDKNGSIQLVNVETERLFGYARQEILHQPVEILIPRKFHEQHILFRHDFAASATARAMAEGQSLFGRRKNGTEFPAEVSLSPIETEGGMLISSAIRDISKRTEFEKQLREHEDRFRLLVSGVTDYAIFMLDPSGKVMSWNMGAQRIKGYEADEILGEHFSRFYPEEDIADGKPERELKLAVEQGRCEDEGWRLRKDGSRFWANVVISAVYDPTGNLSKGIRQSDAGRHREKKDPRTT